MKTRQNLENTRLETKATVFIAVIAVAGLMYIDSASAGGGSSGIALKSQIGVNIAGTAKKSGPCPQPRKNGLCTGQLGKNRHSGQCRR